MEERKREKNRGGGGGGARKEERGEADQSTEVKEAEERGGVEVEGGEGGLDH